MKNVLTKSVFGVLLFFLNCESYAQSNSDKGIILNGLYHLELVDDVDDFRDTYVYVFEGNKQYIFYPQSENAIGYEAPGYYYISNDGKFYSCGIDAPLNQKCKSGNPKYIVVSMEHTVDQFNAKIHQLKLKSYNRLFTLTKYE